MSRALVKTADGMVSVGNIEAQLELIKMFGLAPTMVETHKVIRKNDRWTLVKRAHRINIFSDDSNVMHGALAATIGDRVQLSKPRGKYNDEGRLFDQDSASLKVGEVTAWSAPF